MEESCFYSFVTHLLFFLFAGEANRRSVLLHMPREHLFRTAVRASQLVKDGEVVGKVLDDDGVVHSVVARCSKTEDTKNRVPRVPHFAVDEEEPAAVEGAEGGPSASVHPKSRCVKLR
jgi:hypothetical protein